MFKAPFSFEGRIRRMEYFLSSIIALFVLSIVYFMCFAAFFLSIEASSITGSVVGGLVGIAAYVAGVWFGLAQGVKRLHDLDKSGWMILLFLVPIVGTVFALYLLFADGTVGPNRYGEDPKNRTPYQPYQTQQPQPTVNVTVNVTKDGFTVDTTPASKVEESKVKEAKTEEAKTEVPKADEPKEDK